MNASLSNPARLLASGLLVGSLVATPVSHAASPPPSTKTAKKSAPKNEAKPKKVSYQASFDSQGKVCLEDIRSTRSEPGDKAYDLTMDFLRGLVALTAEGSSPRLAQAAAHPLKHSPLGTFVDLHKGRKNNKPAAKTSDFEYTGHLSTHADPTHLQSAGEMSLKLPGTSPLQGDGRVWGHAVAGEGALGAKAHFLFTDLEGMLTPDILRSAHVNGHVDGTYKKVHYQLHADSAGNWVTDGLAACDLTLQLQRSESDYTLRVQAHAPGTSGVAALLHKINQKSENARKDITEGLQAAHLTLKSFTLATAEAAPPQEPLPSNTEGGKAAPPVAKSTSPSASPATSQGASPATKTSTSPTAPASASPAPPQGVSSASPQQADKAGCTPPDAKLDLCVVFSSKDQHLAEALARELKLEGAAGQQYRQGINEITQLTVDKVATHVRVDGAQLTADLDVDLSEFNHLILGLLDLYISVCECPPDRLASGKPARTTPADALLRQQAAQIRALRPILAEIYQTQGQSTLDGNLSFMPETSGGFGLDLQLGTAFDMKEALPVLEQHHMRGGDIKTFWMTSALSKNLFTAAGNLDYEGPWLKYWKQWMTLVSSVATMTSSSAHKSSTEEQANLFLRDFASVDWKSLDLETAWTPQRYTLRLLAGASDLRPLARFTQMGEKALRLLTHARFYAVAKNGEETDKLSSWFQGLRAEDRGNLVGAVLKLGKTQTAQVVKAARSLDQVASPQVDDSWKATPVIQELKP